MGKGLTKVHEDDTIAVRFLSQDRQRPMEVAGWLADFIGQATESIDLAFYDVHLSAQPALFLRRVLTGRMAAGVRVRLVYDAGDKPQGPDAVERRGTEPVATSDHRRVDELGLPPHVVRAISGRGALMHHKYIVRDGQTVWTGSLNLSDDSMARMENTILTLDDRQIASLYTRDFVQLWGTSRVVMSGNFTTHPVALRFGGQGALADVDFTPGRGREINTLVAERIASAQERIVIATMLFTSSRLLRALLQQLDRGIVTFAGTYDKTQMDGVLEQWREIPELAWKVEAVERIVREAGLVGKQSAPYSPGRVHNFYHNKSIVIDDMVLTGSHNFSHAAQANAENLVTIHNRSLADRVIAFATQVADRYRDGTPSPR
ncbi:MAG: phosphatidylserine/phosphatidylglycerophosphate/cardiolipin synthase family protein [Chloroflexia bacterium]|nr:phosphatidylserine/phosphatidylglycerophosphate/cardiolipin synthase family protein [Chloroflexia bacterium]